MVILSRAETLTCNLQPHMSKLVMHAQSGSLKQATISEAAFDINSGVTVTLCTWKVVSEKIHEFVT